MGQPAWTPSPTKAALLVDFSELLFQFSRFRSDGSNDAVIPVTFRSLRRHSKMDIVESPRACRRLMSRYTAGRALRADVVMSNSLIGRRRVRFGARSPVIPRAQDVVADRLANRPRYPPPLAPRSRRFRRDAMTARNDQEIVTAQIHIVHLAPLGCANPTVDGRPERYQNNNTRDESVTPSVAATGCERRDGPPFARLRESFFLAVPHGQAAAR